MKASALDIEFIQALDSDVLAFVERGLEHRDDEGFNALALRLFELQYRTMPGYRIHCDSMGLVPGKVVSWDEIPAIASFPFRSVLETSLPRDRPQAFHDSSGIVDVRFRKRGPIRPDASIVRLLEVANSALEKEYLFPDLDRMKMLFLIPTPRMAQGMVMAAGTERMRKRLGAPGSRFLIDFGGLDLKGLLQDLRQSERTGEPLALIGATHVFDYFLNACRREGIQFRLPKGSRTCDSGGFMGRYTGCTIPEYLEKCKAVLGVDEDHCINALWICESSTVYFDNVLQTGRTAGTGSRSKKVPPWCKVIAVDGSAFKPVPKGRTGLLRLYDLTNRGMAVAVQTDKMGYETESGFEVTGRWDRVLGKEALDPNPPHPGGKIVSKVMELFLDWKFAQTGRIYARMLQTP